MGETSNKIAIIRGKIMLSFIIYIIYKITRKYANLLAMLQDEFPIYAAKMDKHTSFCVSSTNDINQAASHKTFVTVDKIKLLRIISI